MKPDIKRNDKIDKILTGVLLKIKILKRLLDKKFRDKKNRDIKSIKCIESFCNIFKIK